MGGLFKPIVGTAVKVTGVDKLQEAAAKSAAEKDAALAAENAAKAAEKERLLNVDKDAALLTGKNQDLLNKRVYDMGRVRKRTTDYQAPVLGGDMTGSRKRLLGQ